MDKKNIIPQTAKPVLRVSRGTSSQLAELSEEVLSGMQGITSSSWHYDYQDGCSMDDDAE
ncbi:MAG: DUF5837 family cyanobactin class RiPP [Cyanobacteria bacterium P01_D01_bin.50]